jgi:hypothetical protein
MNSASPHGPGADSPNTHLSDLRPPSPQRGEGHRGSQICRGKSGFCNGADSRMIGWLREV